MSDSDTPPIRDRPDLDSPTEEPLGLKNPLLPARSLGLNQRFLVPLGAQSLSVLDASIFQSDRIQRDFLDSPFQDSPFFSDVDLISVPTSGLTSSSEQQAQDKRDAVPQSEEMWGQRSPFLTPNLEVGLEQPIQVQRSPVEIQQSISESSIQRSQDTAFAPPFENISESPNQPHQSTGQSNNSALNANSVHQVSLSEKSSHPFLMQVR